MYAGPTLRTRLARTRSRCGWGVSDLVSKTVENRHILRILSAMNLTDEGPKHALAALASKDRIFNRPFDYLGMERGPIA